MGASVMGIFQEAVGVGVLFLALASVVVGAVLAWWLPSPWNLTGVAVVFASWLTALRLSAGRPA